MTNKRSKAKRKGSEDPWARAKRLCRLSARHVEMAKALGMNPKKLPGLIPSKTQQWKAPVRVFLEDLYAERFGFDAPLLAGPAASGGAGKRDVSGPIGRAPKREDHAGDHRASDVVIDLVCHLQNLVDDFERMAAAGIEHDPRRQIADHLRSLASDVEAGHVSQVPMVDFGGPDDEFDDDVPF